MERKILNKKNIITLVIPIIFFIILIIGASYAYFLSNVTNLSTEAEFGIAYGERLKIVATGKADLSIDLTLDKMKKFATTKSYYASSVGTTENNPNEVMATIANISSSNGYCDFTVELIKSTVDSKPDMLQNIKTSGSVGEALVKIRSNTGVLSTLDLSTVTWTNNSTTITGRISNLQKGDYDLYIDFMINNLYNNDQAPYLAGSANRISAEIISLDCHAENNVTANYDLEFDYNTKNITLTKKTSKYEPVSYCINTTRNNYSNCTWKSFSSTTVTETMPTTELYYVYVKDNNNNVTYQKVDFITPD